MATWEQVREAALALPETAERSSRDGVLEWRVKDKSFAWERPLRRGELQALGDAAEDVATAHPPPPPFPILAVWLPDLGEKEALLAGDPDVYFTTPHFDGYRIILIRLERIAAPELRELLADSWLQRAPRRLARAYLDSRGA